MCFISRDCNRIYNHGVRLSVRPSVTLMDCDHMVQETVEMGTSQYTGYPHAEADPEYSTVS